MTVSPSGPDEGLPDAELTGPDNHLRVRGAERQQPRHLIRPVPGQPQRRRVRRVLPSLITGPACIGYPLFAAAVERFDRLRPNPAGIAATLSDAALETGLTR